MCPASNDPAQGDAVEADFQRIKRLPPYVFNIVGELKMAARARGEDIIDFGMGNPDQPTPKHIVDKLTETAQRGDTHRYSQSKGIPRLRKAITDWYQRRYDVSLDPETEAIVTIGSVVNIKSTGEINGGLCTTRRSQLCFINFSFIQFDAGKGYFRGVVCH